MNSAIKSALVELASNDSDARAMGRLLYGASGSSLADRSLLCSAGGVIYVSETPNDVDDVVVMTFNACDAVPIGEEHDETSDGYPDLDSVPEEVWDEIVAGVQEAAAHTLRRLDYADQA